MTEPTSIVQKPQGQLVPRQQLTSEVFTLMMGIAPVLHRTAFFRTGSPEQAVAIMIVGYELGFSLTGSFDVIDVIQGRPSLKPKGALALLFQSRVLGEFKIIESNDAQGNPYSCTCILGRRDQPVRFEATFTIEDAIKAGIFKPDSAWDKWLKYMLRWRAIGACVDIVCPDITLGLSIAIPVLDTDIPSESEFIAAGVVVETVEAVGVN